MQPGDTVVFAMKAVAVTAAGDVVGRALGGDRGERLLAGDVRVTGQQGGDLVREDLRGLPDAGVRHLGQVELALAALLVDHEQGGGVVDVARLDLDGDVVGTPGGLQLGQRPGEEVPLVDHAVHP